MIKSRRMRWAGHVARMGVERGCIGSWWGNRREGDHWGDLGVDGWIILGWISTRWIFFYYLFISHQIVGVKTIYNLICYLIVFTR